MGKTFLRRNVIAALVMISAGVFLYVQPDKQVIPKETPLEKAILDLDGWTFQDDIPLASDIVEELQLDDYLFRVFQKEGLQITLYIGYYFTGKKVGAAHDPLVCFPGQGWKISKRDERRIQLNSKHLDRLPFLTMVAENGREKSEIAYWFQAGHSAHLSTFEQKLSLFLNQFIHPRGDNAFVRVSVSLDANTPEWGVAIISDFLKSFYPVFEEYIAH